MNPLRRSYFSRSIRGLSSACSPPCAKRSKSRAQTARHLCGDLSLFMRRIYADKTRGREKCFESQNAIQGSGVRSHNAILRFLATTIRACADRPRFGLSCEACANPRLPPKLPTDSRLARCNAVSPEDIDALCARRRAKKWRRRSTRLWDSSRALWDAGGLLAKARPRCLR